MPQGSVPCDAYTKHTKGILWLIKPSEDFDRVHAHKPWVLKHDGVVYHYYCAVGSKGRGIALATSAP